MIPRSVKPHKGANCNLGPRIVNRSTVQTLAGVAGAICCIGGSRADLHLQREAQPVILVRIFRALGNGADFAGAAVCQIGRQALGRSRADNVVFRTDNPESAANSYFVCFRCNANWHAFFPTGRLQADAWRLSRRSQPEAAQLRRCLLRPQVRFMFGRTGRISAARLVGVACTEWIYRRPPLRFIRRATKVPLAASALPRTTPRSSGLRPCGH